MTDLEWPGPPRVGISAEPTTGELSTAVATLDPDGRLGDPKAPLFLALEPGEVVFLGLTPDSDRWLARMAGDDFARRCRESLESIPGMGAVPGETLHQVQAACAALRRTFAATEFTLTVLPLGIGPDSGSGIAYSHDPVTGAPGPAGVFEVGAIGSDVVDKGGSELPATLRTTGLSHGLPEGVREALEQHLLTALHREHRPVRIEFVIEYGRLWVLSVRRAELGGRALARALADLERRGELSVQLARFTMTPADFEAAIGSDADISGLQTVAEGLGLSPGVAGGVAVFDVAEATAVAASGRSPILVVRESRPPDLPGFLVAKGIVAERGGYSCHAGVIARNLGIPCMASLRNARVDPDRRVLEPTSGPTLSSGDEITVDGRSGVLYRGSPGVIGDGPADRGGADDVAWLLDAPLVAPSLGVRVNADNAQDADRGRIAGAEGVGLCRIEHMFLEDRNLLRDVLVAGRGPAAADALAGLRRALRDALIAIFERMDGLPVTVRLLDPPRHEFVPDLSEIPGTSRPPAGNAAANTAGEAVSEPDLVLAARRLHERNPMLGIRGARLAVLDPALTLAQLGGLLDATIAATRGGLRPRPELLIPMVASVTEVDTIRRLLDGLLTSTPGVRGLPRMPVGAMVETPRAALLAGDLASRVDFFSIGTNDLTALTWGLSRDDAEAELLPGYRARGLIDASPFERLDAEGVGRLLEPMITPAREVRPDISIGVCGEHAHDPSSMAVFADLGIDYVSCAASMVPVARFAALRSAENRGGTAGFPGRET